MKSHQIRNEDSAVHREGTDGVFSAKFHTKSPEIRKNLMAMPRDDIFWWLETNYLNSKLEDYRMLPLRIPYFMLPQKKMNNFEIPIFRKFLGCLARRRRRSQAMSIYIWSEITSSVRSVSEQWALYISGVILEWSGVRTWLLKVKPKMAEIDVQCQSFLLFLSARST